MSSPRCSAQSVRSKQPCRRYAIRGGTVCYTHGGRAPQVKAAAKARLARQEAQTIVEHLGVRVETTPEEALLGQVWEAAGNVELLRRMVQDLTPAVGMSVFGEDGQVIHKIAGPTGSKQKQNEAAPHVLVVMYNEERDRLVRYAKVCADAGVSQQLISLMERHAEQVVTAVETSLEELGVEVTEETRRVLGTHLRLVR